MNSNGRKLKIKKSRRMKLRKMKAQLELLNAKKKTLDMLEKAGRLPKIIKQRKV